MIAVGTRMVGWLGGPSSAFEADGHWQFALALLEKMRRRNSPNKLQLEKVFKMLLSLGDLMSSR